MSDLLEALVDSLRKLDRDGLIRHYFVPRYSTSSAS
jgi:hypothetical protein